MMITEGMFWLLRNGVRQGRGELRGLWSEERKKKEEGVNVRTMSCSPE